MQERLNVRLAKLQDVQRIGDLLEEMHKENGILPLAREKVAHHVLAAVMQSRCFVVEKDAEEPEVIGTAAFDIGPMWYSDEVCFQDLWIFVTRKERRLGVARLLLEALKREAERLQCPAMVAVVSPVDTERKTTLFKRIFGKPIGAVWRIN